METTNLPKPLKMAFKNTDINTKIPEVLLRRLELLNPGIKTTYWKLIDKQADSKGQRLFLLIDQESAKILKRTNLAAYTCADKRFLRSTLIHPEERQAQHYLQTRMKVLWIEWMSKLQNSSINGGRWSFGFIGYLR
jgi:hypothetical protein